MPAGLPTVIADPTYVEQVVRNLLSNAAKYGGQRRDGRGRVEAGRTARSSSGSSTTVRASRPRRADRLFELFFRSARDGARRRRAPGSACSSAPG